MNGGVVADNANDGFEGGLLPKLGTVTTLLEKINKRETRENYLIIFGVTVNESENKQE